MPAYNITIQATVTKTLTVEADCEDSAIEQATAEFTVDCDGGDESYDQQVVEVETA